MSSLRIRLNLCASTVLTLSPRITAISFTELPSASSFRISRSRGVRVEKRGRRRGSRPRGRKSSTSFPHTCELKYFPPFYTSRTAVSHLRPPRSLTPYPAAPPPPPSP